MTHPKIKLSLQEVGHIAQLARIALGPEEEKRLRYDLSIILDYVAQLNEVNTANVEPTSQAAGLKNIVRQDKTKIKNPQERQRILRLSPKIQADYLKVRSVF